MKVEGDTDTVNLDARLGQEVGVLVLVPHKVGRLAALLRAVEDCVPECRHFNFKKGHIRQFREMKTHMRAKQPAKKPMMKAHQTAATTEHVVKNRRREKSSKLERGKTNLES